jgi:hypothetical protein
VSLIKMKKFEFHASDCVRVDSQSRKS